MCTDLSSPNSHAPWGERTATSSGPFAKGQSLSESMFPVKPSGWISWGALPIGKEVDYVHIGLASGQVHLILKNKRHTHIHHYFMSFPFFLALILLFNSAIVQCFVFFSINNIYKLSVTLNLMPTTLLLSHSETSLQGLYLYFPSFLPLVSKTVVRNFAKIFVLLVFLATYSIKFDHS